MEKQRVAKGFEADKHKMSYKEIAETMTAQEGIEYNEEQVKKICQRALKKLEDNNLLEEFERLSREGY